MGRPTLATHFQTLGRYNAIVNLRLYSACAELSDEDYRRERRGSFGSIHRTLNHILLGDRIWMKRFTTAEPTTTPPLHTILHDDFESLLTARVAEDSRIEQFLAEIDEEWLSQMIQYVNSAGKQYSDPASLLLQHMFNHATHHRGQVHVMLSETGVKPVSLDMHRAIRPEPEAVSARG